jgi:hypothetical protein
MDIRTTREKIISDPIKNVPAWTVAAFDPTTGELPRRQLDKKGIRIYLQALARVGAPGVLLASSTGWGHARTWEEHVETLIACGQIQLQQCIKQALLRIEDPLDKNIELLGKLRSMDYGIIWTRKGSMLPPEAPDEKVAQQMLPLVKAITQM